MDKSRAPCPQSLLLHLLPSGSGCQYPRSWLYATLSKSLLEEVHDLPSSKAIRDVLQSRYMDCSRACSLCIRLHNHFVKLLSSEFAVKALVRYTSFSAYKVFVAPIPYSFPSKSTFIVSYNGLASTSPLWSRVPYPLESNSHSPTGIHCQTPPNSGA